jgi:uncharacterized membrane protein
MSELSLIILTANSKDGAAKALDAAKSLDRDGWIEMIDYSLASKDKNGHVTARELDDERSEKVAAAVVGAALGVASGTLGGPAAAAVGAATGAFAGVGSMKLMERIVLDAPPKGFPQSLEPDTSALAVIVEERYAERLDEELQKLGTITRRELKRSERDAEFEAYLQRSKNKIRSIQDDIQAQMAKARTATAAEKTKIEADVAAKRAELEVRRERLEERIETMNTDFKSEIREMNFRLGVDGLNAASAIAAGIDHLHRQLNRYTDELEDLIEHQIVDLKSETLDLRMRASKSSGETKAAVENHLRGVELRLQRERVKLHESLEERLLQMTQWVENFQIQATLLQANTRDKVEALLKVAQHSFAELKARVRMRNREDERAWEDIRAGFNKATEDLEAAFDKAGHERV